MPTVHTSKTGFVSSDQHATSPSQRPALLLEGACRARSLLSSKPAQPRGTRREGPRMRGRLRRLYRRRGGRRGRSSERFPLNQAAVAIGCAALGRAPPDSSGLRPRPPAGGNGGPAGTQGARVSPAPLSARPPTAWLRPTCSVPGVSKRVPLLSPLSCPLQGSRPGRGPRTPSCPLPTLPPSISLAPAARSARPGAAPPLPRVPQLRADLVTGPGRRGADTPTRKTCLPRGPRGLQLLVNG